jgi:hypothetical protein
MRRHEIGGLDRAQTHDVLVGPAVPHDADRPHRQEDRERLRRPAVPVGRAQLVDEDRVGPPEEARVDLMTLTRASLPMFGVQLLILALLTIFPIFSTFLVRLMA